MTRTTTMRVDVRFGDCDPAGIVFFPNFARWMDAASLEFFRQCGVPPWRDLEPARGIVGTPVLEVHTRFLSAATYGETLEVRTSVESWAAKTFRQRHAVWRDADLICEGTEVRAFVARDPAMGRLRALPIPEDLKALCL